MSKAESPQKVSSNNQEGNESPTGMEVRESARSGLCHRLAVVRVQQMTLPLGASASLYRK